MPAAAVALSLAAASTTAWAEPITTAGVGPRVGLSLHPDQVLVGGHLDVRGLADRVRFRPNAMLGLGDDRVAVSIHGDVVYRFRERWDVWSPYLGGALGIRHHGHDRRDDHLDAGLEAVGGIERGIGAGDRFLLEMRLGLLDGPDLAFVAGWTFAR
jgi:hypothetical protein